jgi:proton translocating ATP synthase F1 alpha subunit
MQLNPSEISELLKSKIQGLNLATDSHNQGTVVTVTDGICRVHGLSNVMQGEMLEFPNNTVGLALNLERDSVGAVILGEYENISEGDVVKSTGRILDVPVGPELIGRVVNALGQPIDGKGPINAKMTDIIEKVAPGVIWRKSVSQPVQTGLKAIDSMVPVGRGQRAHHWRSPDRKNGRCSRCNHQSKRPEHVLRLCGDWSEGINDCQRGSQTRRNRCDGLHHRSGRDRLRFCSNAVPRGLLGLHDGRVLP